jgi:hypothetical protein
MSRRPWAPLAAAVAALALAGAAQASDWKPLFDGKSLKGWTMADGRPATGWRVEQGALTVEGRPGDLFTVQTYRDFELEFEWKVDDKTNSGVKYRLHRVPGGAWLGPEYQIWDEGKAGRPHLGATASLYNMIAPAAEARSAEAGKWNRSRIIARGNHLEHCLNGVRTIEIEIGSNDWSQRLARSKFAKEEGSADWFACQPGAIMLQNHGGRVWFRKLRIREFEVAP